MRFQHFSAICLLAFAAAKVEADTVVESWVERVSGTNSTNSLQLEFNDPALGGFERQNLADSLRIRGWKISANTYFGQAKVADKWGLGFIYRNADVVYGINHRGIQVTRRF